MEGLLVVFLVIGIVLLVRIWKRVEALEKRGNLHTGLIENLRRRMDTLGVNVEKLREVQQAGPAVGGDATPAIERPAQVERPGPPPPPVHVPEVKRPPTPPVFPTEPAVKPPTPPVLPTPPAAKPLAREPISKPAAAEPPRIVIPPTPPRVSPPTPPPPPRARPSFDWEGLIGVKLFSWIAGIALALAAVFFLRYSIDRGWLGAPVRMAIGILVGIGLLVVCELKAARKYRVTANALDASGVAILFSTVYASHALWHLIGPIPAFILLVLVTGVAVLLSIRRASLFIALLGLLGGFSTPALLSTGEDHPIGLFGYLLLLNAGLAWVAYNRKWPHLTALSLVFTTLYQWAWVMKFLTAAKLPLAVSIFLIFPILAFVSLTFGQRRSKDPSPLFGQTANASAALPLFLALYLASVPAYGARFGILFGFLLLMDAGFFAIAVARGPEFLHLAGGLSTVAVFVIWFGFSYQSGAWPAILVFIAAFHLFYLGAPLICRFFRREFTGAAVQAAFTAPLLLFVFPVLAAIEPRCAAPGLIFTVLFLLLAAGAAYAVFAEAGVVHFLASFFALAAEAVWSAKYLNADRLLQGLAIYGIFGLFYLGVPIVARSRRKPLRPERAGSVILLTSLALLLFLAAGSIAQSALWGLALLLLILNVGLFLEVSSARLPLLSIVGVVLSWIILAVWWTAGALTALLIPALAVVAAFAILVLGGNIWVQKKTAGADDAISGSGLYLGLVGHLFLMFVASQASLSVPPWPLFGVLAVLDLAIAVAALYTRRDELHVAALILSALILMGWQVTARVAPWPSVAIVSAGVLALFAISWIYLARRLRIGEVRFAAAAVISLILAQIVAIAASALAGSPTTGFLITAQLVFLVALLGLAWRQSWHFLGLVAVLTTAAAVLFWRAGQSGPAFWKQELIFAGSIYLVLLAYPLVLGRRGGPHREPYFAAVLASVPFFFFARDSLIRGGFEGVIGILPVMQAALLAVLLVCLLRIQPPGTRDLGRLALVAGAVLAFITVAIPLQLEKEWITIGWALEGAALAWLYTKIPHRGLLLASCGLLATVFVRLSLNPAIFEYQPRGAQRFWNWYLYTYLVSAATLFMAGRLFRKTDDSLMPTIPRASKLLPAGGTILLFLLLNIEIADFYSTGRAITFRFSATLAQDLTYTLGWALFALTLLAAGITIRSRPARISSLILLVGTVLKCFLHDLGRLGGLYRVGSFVGLAISLALVALALQKFVLAPPRETK